MDARIDIGRPPILLHPPTPTLQTTADLLLKQHADEATSSRREYKRNLDELHAQNEQLTNLLSDLRAELQEQQQLLAPQKHDIDALEEQIGWLEKVAKREKDARRLERQDLLEEKKLFEETVKSSWEEKMRGIVAQMQESVVWWKTEAETQRAVVAALEASLEDLRLREKLVVGRLEEELLLGMEEEEWEDPLAAYGPGVEGDLPHVVPGGEQLEGGEQLQERDGAQDEELARPETAKTALRTLGRRGVSFERLEDGKPRGGGLSTGGNFSSGRKGRGPRSPSPSPGDHVDNLSQNLSNFSTPLDGRMELLDADSTFPGSAKQMCAQPILESEEEHYNIVMQDHEDQEQKEPAPDGGGGHDRTSPAGSGAANEPYAPLSSSSAGVLPNDQPADRSDRRRVDPPERTADALGEEHQQFSLEDPHDDPAFSDQHYSHREKAVLPPLSAKIVSPPDPLVDGPPLEDCQPTDPAQAVPRDESVEHYLVLERPSEPRLGRVLGRGQAGLFASDQCLVGGRTVPVTVVVSPPPYTVRVILCPGGSPECSPFTDRSTVSTEIQENST